MAHADLKTTIEAAWEARDGVKTDTKGAVRDAVETALDLLDTEGTFVQGLLTLLQDPIRHPRPIRR